MKPVDVIRLAGKVNKRALLLDLIEKADAGLIEQIMAPMWKNLDLDYVKAFVVNGYGVRFVCFHRACAVDKWIEVPRGTSITEAKDYFKMGFFTAGGTALVPFVNGERVDDTFPLQGGETVEFKMP